MKNKIKNVLAGACLGLVGMGFLTGCSMTVDQKAALDLITEKSDEIVRLLEENMELQNEQLSKTDAVELVALARTKLLLNKYDELYMKTESQAYDGFWEKSRGSAQGNAPFVYYKKTDTMKYVALCDFDGSLFSIQKADFENNTAYNYDAKDNEKTDTEFESGMFDLSSQVDIMTLIGLKEISVEDIVNIESTENGYKFNILVTIHNMENVGTRGYQMITVMATFEITKDANLKSGTFDYVSKYYDIDQLEKDDEEKVVLGEDGLPNIISACKNVVSLTYNVEYKYSDIDFKFIEDKITEIEL